MDAFVFPSRTDTYGNVVLEALASGVPAIVTDSGGPRSIIRQGENGFVAGDLAGFVSRVEVPDSESCPSGGHALSASWDNVFESAYAGYERGLRNGSAAGKKVRMRPTSGVCASATPPDEGQTVVVQDRGDGAGTTRAIRMSRVSVFARSLPGLMALGFLWGAPLRAQQEGKAHLPLTVHEIVSNLEQRDQARAQALHRFEGTRVYSLHYRGFPHNYDAEMVVNLSYESPASKEFTVVSQSGSKFIVERVFKKMLESEKEAGKDQSRTALSEQNYEFALVGHEENPEGGRYILSVTPKSKNKFLYRGKVWIDAADFAVVKIEAQPAQNPSFWIKRTEIRHAYKKVDNFWLPAENHSESFVRIGGHADLSIEYKDYRITAADPLPAPTSLAHTSAAGPVAAE